MYKRILMPTDGSNCSQVAIREGLELAKNMGARVTFLYVVENISSSLWISPESVPYGLELLEDLKRVGNEALSKASELAQAAGVEAETKLVEARPVEAILNEAKNHDLIVMGTHGRSGLDRFMLGSVTEAVLHRSDRPVLVLRCK
ncbi:MAG: universal stress protein [Meiothermus ruber]|mgnify:FL=1|jgi:nucleotide-binding universal stress UspA family protein|uniref:Universal stress protein n=1 Tax=Meiothermus ruber TaxID=277 RepID=A0A7C3HJE9_MEIRU|nr:universal stress protein [Meiothermus sp.]MCX8088687.1 universal stress protein [Meiothermus ruber]GIW29358.1 MAG: universal stress protein [Meiothermus sp.]GIW38688.1 MAG: universal stress protein [Meiothermus sp.]